MHHVCKLMLQWRGLSAASAAQQCSKTQWRRGAASVWHCPTAVTSGLGDAVGEGTSVSLA